MFNLSVGPGSVIGRAEVMRIVPDGGGLKAKVFLPNSELGFIKDGMPVKLAVSSFPPGEYGYLKGTVTNIGADALSSDQQSADRQRANTFPMTIELTGNEDKSAILDRLAPGMQVSANIIVRQRPVITPADGRVHEGFREFAEQPLTLAGLRSRWWAFRPNPSSLEGLSSVSCSN